MGQKQVENSNNKDKIIIGSNNWLSIQENDEVRSKNKTRTKTKKTIPSNTDNKILETLDENDLENDNNGKTNSNNIKNISLNSISHKNNTLENFILTDDNNLNTQTQMNFNNLESLANTTQILEMKLENIKTKDVKKEKRFESFEFEGYEQTIEQKNLYLCEKLINQQYEDYRDFINHDFKFINEMLYNTGEIKDMINYNSDNTNEKIEEVFNIMPKFDPNEQENLKTSEKNEHQRFVSFNANKQIRKSSIYTDVSSTFLDDIRISKISNDEKKKLIDNYLNDILNINDKGFINKFSIVMHKYFNVSLY